mmetsp:Transcript_2753/g.8280  ORF Transcript_2753/g.8280 Transcript_2753/m.8280 type:complete len:98 (-) Transcript_2753:827-1120(-)
MNESSPVVGSSSMMTAGSETSARPILTRLACPPEIPLCSGSPINVWRHACRRNSWHAFSAAARFSAMGSRIGRLSSAVYISISITDKFGMSVSNCST